MIKKILFAIVAFIIIAFLWLSYQMHGLKSGQEKGFEIEKGQGVSEISKNLKEQGIIKNSLVFKLYVWYKHAGGKLQAGQYFLDPKSGVKKILENLTGGKVFSQEKIIEIKSWWSLKNIAEYLEDEGVSSKEDFFKVANSKEIKTNSKYRFLADIPADKNIEGFLFPDTYRIYKNASAEDVILKILDEGLGKRLSSGIEEDIKKEGKTIYEIMTMASIIQREVPKKEDMKMISDIFWRRIDAGMPLQSCATIAYILGENKEQYSYEETRVESPYNTYLNRGLPPTPICNPELAAIEAAIYPQPNPYWYFLSKQDGSGETVFAKSLEEHNRNKAIYLK